MNDDSPVSVDVSVAFFASVLVLFVFVTFALNRETPRVEPVSTGQIIETAAAIPPSWGPIPERTSYAFLDSRQLQVLEMEHFSVAMVTPEKMVSSDAHFENITVLSDRNAPESFSLNIGTVGGVLPSQWVRATVPAVRTQDGGCPIDEQTWSAFRRNLLSVLVMRSEKIDLPEFVAFADTCGLRYRLIPLPTASAKGRVNIPISLQPNSFRFETIFR
uniref:Uncharacterized protein n=1 Tax=Candidatus Kentrum eta TaxID=2126337 RepID=A0A450V0G4_9GAMM|nr:MAG: hypothetical protein BECKH772A_GA0070896_1002210 [Candidatus Kentron sp. H]VFJ91681.1 MAG: hypothetical protein BECKH772B_GA0070898_1002010 [Candidatus Kentron sp. H]VFJ98298.1 MAG: hypothetical protein BECKH772C_GA0070978_1002010 [Candidatus Kentron sp. H]